MPQYLRGIYKANFPLKNLSFLKVGGPCDAFFVPSDLEDLYSFLEGHRDRVTVLGNMSNVLISDLGIRGSVIRLDNLKGIKFGEQGYIDVQSGASLNYLIQSCLKRDISCCEKLYSIPGTLGGALYMNAGIPGFEISDVLISVTLMDLNDFSKVVTLSKSELNMEYRNGNIPDRYVILSARLQTFPKDGKLIQEELNEINRKRMRTQPIGQPTCGSTFKNPNGAKTWKLIKQAGCGNLSIGGARVSEVHANFLVNAGGARASDFVELIEIIKSEVLRETGYALEEEIIRMGEFASTDMCL